MMRSMTHVHTNMNWCHPGCDVEVIGTITKNWKETLEESVPYFGITGKKIPIDNKIVHNIPHCMKKIRGHEDMKN